MSALAALVWGRVGWQKARGAGPLPPSSPPRAAQGERDKPALQRLLWEPGATSLSSRNVFSRENFLCGVDLNVRRDAGLIRPSANPVGSSSPPRNLVKTAQS